jgi:hypothetical protein
MQNGKETIWGEGFIYESGYIQEVVNGIQTKVFKYTLQADPTQLSTAVLGVLPIYFSGSGSKENGWKVQDVRARGHKKYGW